MNPWYAKAIVLLASILMVAIRAPYGQRSRAVKDLGQALVVPNWIAGPSYLVAMALLFALPVRPEERMMADRFKSEYEAYASRTKRLIPGLW